MKLDAVYFGAARERCFDASMSLNKGLEPSECIAFNPCQRREAAITQGRHQRQTDLRDRKSQLVELINTHFQSANAAVGQSELKQHEGPQDAGASGGRDADADSPSHAGQTRLRDFVVAERGKKRDARRGWGGGGGVGGAGGRMRKLKRINRLKCAVQLYVCCCFVCSGHKRSALDLCSKAVSRGSNPCDDIFAAGLQRRTVRHRVI